MLVSNKGTFFGPLHAFHRRPWVFSHSSGCGARRRPIGTLRRTPGSRPSSAARALDGRSPLSLASNHGIAFRPARANQARANPKNVSKFFIFSPLMLFLKYHNSCERLGNQGTTAAALQAFPFVTATNGASKCGFMRVCACACVCLSVIVASYSSIVGARNTAVSRREVWCCLSFSLFSVLLMSAAAAAAAAVYLYHTVIV